MPPPFVLIIQYPFYVVFVWPSGTTVTPGEGELVVVEHRSHGKEKGLVLVLGQGDVGQLGLGEDVLERKKPALVNLPEGVVQAVAGGMHTVCLGESGKVSDKKSCFFMPFKLHCALAPQSYPVPCYALFCN